MTIDDALARLSAGLEEDERIARRTHESASHLSPNWRTITEDIRGDTVLTVLDEHDARVAVDMGVAGPHIAHHDPARALRQVEAIRELVQWYRTALAEAVADSEKPSHLRIEWDPESVTLGVVLRILAGIYTEPTEERP